MLIYLMMLSVVLALHWLVGWVGSNELDWMWKAVVMA